MRRSLVRATGLAALCVVLLAACLDATTGRPPSSASAAPAYGYSISGVSAESLGASWRPGCPVGPRDLRRLRVNFWGYDGAVHIGTLVVHHSEAVELAWVFGRLYADRFQIRRMHPVSSYGGSDDRSMEANNTSAFNCRTVTGGTGWSEHSYGRALDLNPVQNPYVTRSGTVLPPSGRPWADRSLRVPGMVHAGSQTTAAFGAVGWRWGGSWSTVKDYQHFSSTGR